MDSINRMAIELVDEAIDFADELRIDVYELDSGATALDFGVNAEGGIEAGLLLAEIETAGLATVQAEMDEVAGAPRPRVELQTDHPALALLCSQKAGWELAFESGFEGLGSGPARALVAEEDEFHQVEYFDEFDLTVLGIESIELPGDEVAEHVARKILSAIGSAPVAPVSYDEGVAMGRTNDALAYGGEVHLTVTEDSEHFADVPSTAADEYGTPFEQIFEDADWDFYDIPETVFAPAKVTVDVVDGPTRVFGETNENLLAESFGVES
jgi:methenyltetrahydromethanopterin cyclohydrolase